MKKFIVLGLSLVFSLSMNIFAQDANIKDVDSKFWAYTAIQDSLEKNIMTLYPDDKFRPDNKVKRSEFAVMFSSVLKIKENKLYSGSFQDVKEQDWYSNYVENIKDYELNKTEFRPSEILKKKDAVYTMVKSKNLKPFLLKSKDQEKYKKLFEKIPKEEASVYITAIQYGILSDDENMLNLDQEVDRAQMAKLFYNYQRLSDEKFIADVKKENQIGFQKIIYGSLGDFDDVLGKARIGNILDFIKLDSNIYFIEENLGEYRLKYLNTTNNEIKTIKIKSPLTNKDWIPVAIESSEKGAFIVDENLSVYSIVDSKIELIVKGIRIANKSEVSFVDTKVIGDNIWIIYTESNRSNILSLNLNTKTIAHFTSGVEKIQKRPIAASLGSNFAYIFESEKGVFKIKELIANENRETTREFLKADTATIGKDSKVYKTLGNKVLKNEEVLIDLDKLQQDQKINSVDRIFVDEEGNLFIAEKTELKSIGQ